MSIYVSSDENVMIVEYKEKKEVGRSKLCYNMPIKFKRRKS